MIDLWIAVILTVIVSLLTILADWLASTLIVKTKTLRSVQNIFRAGLSSSNAQKRVCEVIERYSLSQSNPLAWGADLATVAISMDIAALGIWIHNSALFPFFSRFNTANASREIPIWLIVVGLHFILLIVSLLLKHNHAEAVTGVTQEALASFPRKSWFAQNGWMMAANSTGFVSLLTSIVVFTNAL